MMFAVGGGAEARYGHLERNVAVRPVHDDGHHLRQSRRDRILRGQAAARALSIRFGRPPIAKAKVEKAKRFLAAGKGVRQVARMAGISPASVSRIKTSMNNTEAVRV